MSVKRFICGLLAWIFIITLVPAFAVAAVEEEPAEEVTEAVESAEAVEDEALAEEDYEDEALEPNALAESQASLSDLNTSTVGEYVWVEIGSGPNAARIMNGNLGKVSEPSYEHYEDWDKKDFKWTVWCKKRERNAANEKKVINPKGSLSGSEIDANKKKGTLTDDDLSISRYNMFKNFGIIDNDNIKTEATAGFSISRGTRGNGIGGVGNGNWVGTGFYANAGDMEDSSRKANNFTCTLGIKKDEMSSTRTDRAEGLNFTAKVSFSSIPELAALAKSGDLQYRVSGYIIGGCEKFFAWPDDDDITTLTITEKTRVDKKTVSNELYKGATTEKVHIKPFNEWGYISKNVTELEFYFDITPYKERFWSNCWGEGIIGLGNGTLIFYKRSYPRLTYYDLQTNGSIQYNNAKHKNEILLGREGKFELTFHFTETVTSMQNNKNLWASDAYKLMDQLVNHALFYNQSGTGYVNQGEAVYMSLVGGRSTITGGFSSLVYQYDAASSPGAYYGNNPIPNGGDWTGLTTASNGYCLLDKLCMASLHDYAGNPLCFGTEPVEKNDRLNEQAQKYTMNSTVLKRTLLKGTVRSYGTATGTNLTYSPDINLYTATNYENISTMYCKNDPFGDFDIIIDAVSPTFSVTSNGVQPDILTQLTLNKGDEFDIDLNFSEGVQLRKFKTSKANGIGLRTGGIETFNTSNLYLEFNNGMKAVYVKGNGERSMTFRVTVPGDKSAETDSLELKKIGVEGSSDTYILTDYVGNPLEYQVGVQRNTNNPSDTYISWTGLSVDNTAPTVEVTVNNEAKAVNVYATDPALSNGADGSGVFTPLNSTNHERLSYYGLIYYVWVNGEEARDKAIADLSANNYAAVKRYSLTATQPDGYIGAGAGTLQVANNNSLITFPEDMDSASGTWYLVVFTSDMTWDSARQRIQYNKLQQYKKTESGLELYFGWLVDALGASLSAEPYTVLAEEPKDWEDNYYNYYECVDGVYKKVEKGLTYVDFESDTYYKLDFLKLESEPSDWENNYTAYYAEVNGNPGSYKQLTVVSPIPEWKENTYYTNYTLSVSEDENGSDVEPSDWRQSGKAIGSGYYKRYTRANSDGSSTSMWREIIVPKYEANKYYVYRENANPFQGIYTDYELVTSEYEPSDWAENYNTTYYEHVDEYFSNVGSLAKYEPGKYSTGTFIPLGSNEPDDWNTNYKDYYRLGDLLEVEANDTTIAIDDAQIWYLAYYEREVTAANFDTLKNKLYIRVSTGSGTYEYEKVTGDYNSNVTYYVPANSETYVDLSVIQDGGELEDIYNSCPSQFTVKIQTYTNVLGDAPVFQLGKYFYCDYEYDLTTSQPADWGIVAYYVKSGEKYVEAPLTDTWKPLTYYEKGAYTYTLLTDGEAPEDWGAETYYSNTSGKEVASGTAYEANKYYSRDAQPNYKLLTEKPADWETNASSYFQQDVTSGTSAVEYISVVLDKPEFVDGKYYKVVAFTPVYSADTPADWDICRQRYYIYIAEHFDNVSPSDVSYSSGSYYSKNQSKVLLTAKPNDWDTSYYYYLNSDGTTVQDVKYPDFSESTYYKYDYTKMDEEPIDWKSGYRYYFTKNTSGEYEAVTMTVDNRKSEYPEFKTGTYYKSSEGITSLASRLGTTERYNGFVDSMLNASTYSSKLTALTSYSEFADAIYTADQQGMIAAGNYDIWTESDFSSDDSNWVASYASTILDNSPAIVTIIPQEGNDVTGNDTENPTVVAEVKDDGGLSAVTMVEYKYVTPGTTVTFDAAEDWLVIDTSKITDDIYTFSCGDYNSYYGLDDGEYELWVRTKDSAGNKGCVKVADVKLNTIVTINQDLSASGENGAFQVKMRFSGYAFGKDLFDSKNNFKISYAVDQNPLYTSSTEWTTITNEYTECEEADKLGERDTRLYQTAVMNGLEGSYYLHIKLEYGSKGVAKYINQRYTLRGSVKNVTFSQLGQTKDTVTMQVTADNAAALEYVWLPNGETLTVVENNVVMPEGFSWTQVPNATFQYTRSILGESVNTFSLWVKATDALGNISLYNKSYSLAAEKIDPSGKLVNPKATLIDVVKSGKNYIAYVALEMDEEELSIGTQYSTAVATGKKLTAAVLKKAQFSAFKSYENIIAVSLGTSISNRFLLIKFKNSDGAQTAQSDYIQISDFSVNARKSTTEAPVAYVTAQRSTNKSISSRYGMDIQFTCRDGYRIEDGSKVHVAANGMYKYNILNSAGEVVDTYLTVVSNIVDSVPNWTFTFSETDATLNPVKVSLTADAAFCVKSISIKYTDGTTANPRPSAYFTMTKNGTATIQFVDEAGNVGEAVAKVTWILDKEAEKPDVTISYDYSQYNTLTDESGKVLAASGVDLICTSDDDFFVVSGTTGPTDYDKSVTVNDKYSFTFGSGSGVTVKTQEEVANIIDGIDTPTVTIEKSSDGKKLNVVIEGKVKGYELGNRVYDGRTIIEHEGVSAEDTYSNEIKTGNTTYSGEYYCDNEGNYRIVKTYTSNGKVTNYVCDKLGNYAAYTLELSELDRDAPVITFAKRSITVNVNTQIDVNWLLENGVTITDNYTPVDVMLANGKIVMTDVDTGSFGAHSYKIIATDEAGWSTTAEGVIFVTDGQHMIATDENGIGFYSNSVDAIIVEDDHITLSVMNYGLMDYQETLVTDPDGHTTVGKNNTGTKVNNTKATYSIYIQKGLYREGQLKYISTVTVKDQDVEEVEIKPEQLDGAGWYTIIIRTSERTREYTSFFISSSYLETLSD